MARGGFGRGGAVPQDAERPAAVRQDLLGTSRGGQVLRRDSGGGYRAAFGNYRENRMCAGSFT